MPEVIFTGPEGKLEGRYIQGRTEDSPVALILHPHPLDGGTMNNKVVYNLFHIFAKRGFAVLRFNFRGVGKSEGVFSKAEGVLADAATAIDWLQKQNNYGKKCWIAGFSYGSYVAMQLLMRRPEFHRFIAVAPTPNLWDFSFLSPCPTSGLVLHASEDQFVNLEVQSKFVEKLKSQKNINVGFEVMHGANHFFTNHMAPMQELVGNYIDAQMAIIENSQDKINPDSEEDDDYYQKIRELDVQEDDEDE